MEITVHRGTHQIGGCVTEIRSSKGTKIAIDIGAELPNDEEKETPVFEIEGLTTGEKSFEAVFVTHYHGDHIGMYNKVLKDISIYIGKDSKEIFKILQEKLFKAKRITEKELKLVDKFKTYEKGKKIPIKDIVVTPIEVDHSAFNAHMLLIECDGKKVLHTGDFRMHGQRGKAVLPAVEMVSGEVDCLICEGTTLSRESKTQMQESNLQYKAEEIFRENRNAFVMCSSTNIDRIAAIHKAALNAGRFFVCDDYQKKILMYIDSISRASLYKFKDRVVSYAPNVLKYMKEKGFVMLVRNNYISKQVMKEFPDNVFVYSEWLGYLDKRRKEYKIMQEFVPEEYIYLHTSGHADREAIEKVCKITKPKILIPIHGETPEAFENMRTSKL